jgi:hypothetical protein
MRRLTLTRLGPGHKVRRALALLTLVALCVMLVLTCAGASLAADEGRTIDTPGGAITTSEGMEAPQLDYHFVWWSFILTFGLLIVYYVWILRISDKEFKKIIDAHFGPKQDGR